MTDIIIVGGGISGMLSAWYLARAGARVRVLDRQAPGRESSWAGGGIVSPLYPWRYAAPVNRLARWSQQQFPALAGEIAATSGIDPEYLNSGLLMPGLGEGEYRQALQWAGGYGADLQTLSDADLITIQGGLQPPSGQHLWLPAVAQVRNPRLLKSLHEALLQLGVEVLADQPVSELALANGPVQGVVVRGQTLPADKVVLCAGAWTDQIQGHQPTGIYPVRGQMLMFQASDTLLSRIVLAGETYLIPRRDGKIIAGSTMERVGFDKATTSEAREDLFQRAIALLPALADCPVIHHWAGLRPGNESGIPCISAHPGIEGLFINAGQYRNGIVTGPASARLLSDLLLERPPILDPDAYRLGT
ncbi:MAG: FAD-dependent oxidoreductase [Chromatiales bacterium]|nr:FAD-dependent oxidoreductase [Chromatiales bacterium]